MEVSGNPQGSESSIADRFAAHHIAEVQPEAAPAPAVARPQPEPEPAEVEAQALPEDDPQPEAADEEWADIEEDGKTYRVPAAAKDGYMRRADYSRKTEEAASLAKMAQDRLHYAEAREQFNAQVVDKVAHLRALESQLKQFDGIDIGSLYATDTASAMRLRDQRDEIRRQAEEARNVIGQMARQHEAMQQSHFTKQWEIAVNGAKQRIGAFTPGEDVAMAKQIEALGISPDEIKGRYADPRILHAIYKAAKWDALQKSKAGAVASVQAAPPVVKPGASKGPGVASEQKYRDARAQLRKSGNVQDAQRLFLLRG